MKKILHTLVLSLSSLDKIESKALTADNAIDVNTMGDYLRLLLGQQALIIHPKMSLDASPINENPEKATKGAILYSQLIHKHCLVTEAEHRILPKPLVLMIAKPRLSPSSPHHWHLLMVLPAHFQPAFGEPLNTQTPHIFFFDPSLTSTSNEIPAQCQPFYQMLTQGYRQVINIQGKPTRLTVLPAFPKAPFYHGNQQALQLSNDSGYWTIRAALLTVLTGRAPEPLSTAAKEQKMAHIIRTGIHEALTSIACLNAKPSLQSASTLQEMNDEKKITPPQPSATEKSSLAKQKKLPLKTTSPMSLPSVAKPLKPTPMESKKAPETLTKKPVQTQSTQTKPERFFTQTDEQDKKNEQKNTALIVKHYTLAHISAILQAKAIPSTAKQPLPIDDSGQFVYYCKAPQNSDSECFIEDLADYFFATQGKIPPRRVGFIFPMQGRDPIALLIQNDQPDITAARVLYNTCQQNNIHNTTSLAAHAAHSATLRKLYSQVNIQVLGLDAKELSSLLQPLTQGLAKAYQPTSNKVSVQCKKHPPSYATLLLPEDIANQLRAGKTNEMTDFLALQTQHAALVRSELVRKLEALSDKEPQVYAALHKNLQRLIKYSQLDYYRTQKYAPIPDTLDALDQLQHYDQAVKAAMYQLPLQALNTVITPLTFPTMLALLSQIDRPRELLTLLQQQADQELQKIYAWETQLMNRGAAGQRDCWTRTQRLLSKGSSHCYRHSYVGLGDQLSGLFASPLSGNNASKLTQIARYTIQKASNWSVFLMTASSERAQRAEQETTAWFDQDPVKQSFRLLGISFGIAYTLSMGWRGAMRMAALGYLAQLIGQYFMQAKIDDLSATAIPPGPLTPDPISTMRLVSLAFTIAESTYHESYLPVIAVMGGMASSMLMRAGAERAMPSAEVKPDNIEQAQQRASILFLLSVAAYEIGQRFALGTHRIYHTIQHKLINREYALMQLHDLEEKGQARFMNIEYPSLYTSPRLWVGAKNPIRFTALGPNHALYDANCQIDGAAPYVTLTCDQDIPSLPRLA